MPVLPIAVRELGVISRGRGLYRMRLAASVTAGLAMVWMLLFGAAQVSMAEQGALLFWILSCCSFAYCSVAGVIWTAGGFNAEKREGTLGLLFLTSLKRYDVVFGKIVSSSISAAVALVGIVPVLALGLLLGGVEPAQFGLLLVVLGSTMLLSLACGAFASVLCESAGRALFLTAVLLFLITVVPFALNLAIDPDSVRPDLAIGSPLAAFMILWPPGAFSAQPFVATIIMIHLTAWLFLSIAIICVENGAYDEPAIGQRLGWKERWRRFTRHSAAGRRLRLDENPYAWLGDRTRFKQTHPWIFLMALGLIWSWVAAHTRGVAFETALGLPWVDRKKSRYRTL